MRIGINGRFLLKPFTGIGQHTINLVKELAKIDLKKEYVFFVMEKVGKEVTGLFSKNVKFVILPEKKMPSAGAKKVWWEQIQLPEILLKEKFDVAFFPYPSNPWTNDFYKKGIKTFVTVHDCLPWKYKHYTGGILSRMAHEQSKKAVSKADVVFTVSETSGKEIVKICKVKESRVFVIYNDAGDIFKKAEDQKLAKKILTKFGIKKNEFIFYCGGFDERKNVEKLVEEYSEFAKSNSGIPLVLAGGKALGNKLYESFDKTKSEFGKIIKTGFLKEEELKSLYENCMAFVHLSREEGFNIPVVEAANCGAPLILSNTKIHKEIAKTNASFVNISKKYSCQKEMGKMLNSAYRSKFSKKAKELSKKYSWKISAKKAYDVLFSK
jgi:glycosyltransferase involved in cell wall biosynthesis